MKYLSILIILLLIVVAGILYFDGKSVPTTTTTVVEETITTKTPQGSSNSLDKPIVGGYNTPIVVTEENPKPSVKSFTITGQNYSFAPNFIKVKKGDTVKITFQNLNGRHNLIVEQLNIATKILNEGEQQTITFVADQVGTFEYYCSVGNHRLSGMHGIIKVE
ncbi:MAG: cupredoxin domain-containing protein [Candidatus Pacebacteria bacterium]|jgi:plastocyanin|nr:cupredoxin domain-containing protein [Candidatus Paceibacterota bacterium]